MATSDERRKVAEDLRDLRDDCYRIRYAEEFYDELRKIVALDLDGTFEGVANSLAGLIDPTCRMTECSIDHGSRSWGMRCSRCGTEFEHERPAYGWRYCPNCGARVKGSNSMPLGGEGR